MLSQSGPMLMLREAKPGAASRAGRAIVTSAMTAMIAVIALTGRQDARRVSRKAVGSRAPMRMQHSAS
jgi:hypothetical protein